VLLLSGDMGDLYGGFGSSLLRPRVEHAECQPQAHSKTGLQSRSPWLFPPASFDIPETHFLMKRDAATKRAVGIIERLGIALVYPIDNRPEPPSLWSALHPRTKMRWSWDADADDRVVDLWHLRERLARSHDVAYAKWFRGRATFFSLPIFHAMLGRLSEAGDVFAGLPREAHEILELLRERSPISTKQIRSLADLRGKDNEALFQHAMKALWSRLLIVGTGEVEDGAFPSLAVGATELLFEDAWNERRSVPKAASKELTAILERTPAFKRDLQRAVSAVYASTK